MTVFLYTATDANGTSEPGRIDAASVAAARHRLEQQGLRDIVFHTDEGSVENARAHGLPGTQADVTPAQELRARHQAPRGLAFIAKVYAAQWLLWLPVAAWALWNLARGAPYSFGDYASFVLAPVAMALPLWMAAPARAYNALLEASAWARWDEVVARCAFFRRWGRFFLAKPPALEVDVREACAIAARGDLPTALARVRRYEDSVQPKHVYLGRVAGLYTAARDWAGMARCQEEAWQQSGGAPMQAIDYATTLAWRLRDADGAERVLASVDRTQQAQLAQSFIDFTEGLIALERQQNAQAMESLQHALIVQRGVDNPLTQCLADFIQAHLAIAVARSGEKGRARGLLRASLPRLTAHKDLDLARRCAAAVA